MLACATPASALAHDPPAEVPDVAGSGAQAVGGPAFGAAARSEAPALWATVNICDTAGAPDSMGILAGMPGTGRGGRMYMRFSAQYWSRARQAWAAVAGSGVSPWVDAGSARRERRQTGWTFSLAAPPQGVTFTMRAIVEFEWRGRRLRSRRRITRTGIPGVQGGDPAGLSKAMCLIY